MESEKINVSGDSFPVSSPWSEPVRESVFSIAPQTVPDYLSIDAGMDKLRVDWDEQPRSVCAWEEELERDFGRRIKTSIKPLDTLSIWAEKEADEFKISAQPLSTWAREMADEFKISAQPLRDISIWTKEEGELCRTSVLSKLNSMWGDVPSFQPLETTVYAENVVIPSVLTETPRVTAVTPTLSAETPKPLPEAPSTPPEGELKDADLHRAATPSPSGEGRGEASWEALLLRKVAPLVTKQSSRYTWAHVKKVLEDHDARYYADNADFGRHMAQIVPSLKARLVAQSVSRNSKYIACGRYWTWPEGKSRELCEKVAQMLGLRV